MEYPCSPFSWDMEVAPHCNCCCFIPRRHRAFFQSQLGSLPVYDEVMKEMTCNCANLGHSCGHGDDLHQDIGHPGNNDHGEEEEEEGVDEVDVVASTVCPNWSAPATIPGDEYRGAQGKFGTTSGSSSSGLSPPTGGHWNCLTYPLWNRHVGTPFNPNARWPEMGYWRRMSRNKPHHAYKQGRAAFMPASSRLVTKSYRDVI